MLSAAMWQEAGWPATLAAVGLPLLLVFMCIGPIMGDLFTRRKKR